MMTALAPWRTIASVRPRQIPLPPPEQRSTLPAKMLSLKIVLLETAAMTSDRKKWDICGDKRGPSDPFICADFLVWGKAFPADQIAFASKSTRPLPSITGPGRALHLCLPCSVSISSLSPDRTRTFSHSTYIILWILWNRLTCLHYVCLKIQKRQFCADWIMTASYHISTMIW